MSETVLFPSGGVPRLPGKPGPQVVVHKHGLTLGMWAPIVVAVLIVGGFFGWEKFRDRNVGPAPGPGAFNARTEGRALPKDFGRTFAESAEIAEREIRSHAKPLSQIKADHVERWKGTRDAAFTARFEKALDAIIAPGNDRPTNEQLDKYADLWHEIIAGAKEGSK